MSVTTPVFLVGRLAMVELSGTLLSDTLLTLSTQLGEGEFRFIYGMRLVNGDDVARVCSAYLRKSDGTILLKLFAATISAGGSYNFIPAQPIWIGERMKITIDFASGGASSGGTAYVKILEVGVRL